MVRTFNPQRVVKQTKWVAVFPRRFCLSFPSYPYQTSNFNPFPSVVGDRFFPPSPSPFNVIPTRVGSKQRSSFSLTQSLPHPINPFLGPYPFAMIFSLIGCHSQSRSRCATAAPL
ncbi:hypothetical protein NPIL_234711 [Nephila pilipes]|uniref:Uncharacterized protein n=1 Tax=Nephila pilipes TaxID=299642 RepID=A0A8X6UAZ4_NEPPI|nr:hypothetical protein NPIL_234711 [Nephila pilipes]